MPKLPAKPKSRGLDEFAAETTSNPSEGEKARRERVAAAGEAGDLVKQQTERYGADRESAGGSWFLPLSGSREFLRVCWYGNEDAGKTTHMATAANHGRILIVNAETGVKKKALANRGINVDNIMVWPDHERGEKVTKRGLRGVFENLQADLEADPNSWYGVGFDSFTELTFLMVQGAQRRRINQLVKAGRSPDREFTDRSDYGMAAKWLAELIRDFRVLPLHVMVTALMRRDEDGDTGRVRYGPATSPAVQNDLAGMMDILAMCKGEDADGPNRALMHGIGRYRAKDRFGVAPRVLVDPTFERYLSYYDGALTADTDPEQKRLKAAKKGKKGSGDAELDTADELDEEE